MTDHNRTDAFNKAVTAAKSRHQQAVMDAHEEFNTAISKADRHCQVEPLRAKVVPSGRLCHGGRTTPMRFGF
jgi:hypothetical protein